MMPNGKTLFEIVLQARYCCIKHMVDDDLRNYFLVPFGAKPVGKTMDSNIDLGEIVREMGILPYECRKFRQQQVGG